MLIVEDQDYMRAMLREFVQSAYPDKHVLEAKDGSSGLALCYAYRPQVVLMDIRLPDANGIDLTAQIRKRLPDTEVIIVSSLAGSAYVERAKVAGACAYVTKDAVHEQLLPAIAVALEQRTGIDPNPAS